MIRRAIVGGVIFLCVLAAGAAWFAYSIFADRSDPSKATAIVIPRGSSFAAIAETLGKNGVIANPLAFRLYARLRHADGEAHAGEFRFAAHQSAASVLSQLEHGGAQVARWVTFPEGFTARQVAQRLERDGFGDWRTFDRAFMHDSIVIDGTRTKNLEGFLFPSTYLIPIGASPQTVEHIMTRQFLLELPSHAAKDARTHGLTVPQVVTLASLVEREAKADDERALMAGVYYNRLRIGMPLQVDATIEYALPHHATVITRRDLTIDSPYNSYLHTGLPPTPIANPGEPSLLAAFHPRPSPYLYYVYKGDGHHAFAKTFAQQSANVARYLK